MENQEYVCEICGTELNDTEIFQHQPTYFNYVCKEHKGYAKIFLSQIVKEKLGYKEKTEHKCNVCKKILTNEELQGCLDHNSFNILCKNHIYRSSELILK